MFFVLNPFELMACGLIYLVMERLVPGWKETAMKIGRDWTGIVMSLLVVGAAFYAMAVSSAMVDDLPWVTGAIGAIAGYWTKE